MSTVQPAIASPTTTVARRQSVWRGVLHTTEGQIGVGLGMFMIGLIVLGRSWGPTRPTTRALPARARRRRTGSAPTPWAATC